MFKKRQNKYVYSKIRKFDLKLDVHNRICTFDVINNVYNWICTFDVINDVYNGICTFDVINDVYNWICTFDVINDVYNGICTFDVINDVYNGIYKLSLSTSKFVINMSRSTRKPTLWALRNVSDQISMRSPRRLIRANTFRRRGKEV